MGCSIAELSDSVAQWVVRVGMDREVIGSNLGGVKVICTHNEKLKD